MEIDLELQEKEVFREVITDGEFETIAIWLDGDWSITSSSHFKEKLQEGNTPICFINKAELTSNHSTIEEVDELIGRIERKLNPCLPSVLDYFM